MCARMTFDKVSFGRFITFVATAILGFLITFALAYTPVRTKKSFKHSFVNGSRPGFLNERKERSPNCIGTDKEKRQLKEKYKNLKPGWGSSSGDYGCNPIALGPGRSLDERCARDAALLAAAAAKKKKAAKKGNRSLFILSKPRAKYTCKAKLNDVKGKVFLKISFLRSGKIGKIKAVEGLADGLTEQALEAAKKIKFRPAMKEWKRITVTKKVSYNFTIY